jgi:tetrahydromethanopterin S-methyltransferase subunit B
MNKTIQLKIKKLEDTNRELKVVIDTLQTALRSCDKTLKDHPQYDSIFTTSAKWSMNFKQ